MEYKKIHGLTAQRNQALRNKRRGRRQENALVDYIGFIRSGAYGEQDGFDSIFSAEIKDRAKYIGATWFKQAIKNAKKKIPLMIIHITRTRKDSSLVHMQLKDWLQMYACALKGGYQRMEIKNVK